MGEILSTIKKWIDARYEGSTGMLKEALGVVNNVIEGIMRIASSTFNLVSSFRYTREKEYFQSEITGAGGDTIKSRVETGREKCTIGTASDNDDQLAAPQKLPSDMSEKEKEAFMKNITICRQSQEDVKETLDILEDLVKPGQHYSRETEMQKLEALRKKPCFKNIQAALAKHPTVNSTLA